MQVKSAEYLISSPSLQTCPKTDLPEFAFIGRSNVGKSSLINMLTNRKNLAKTSATPGKTQYINHFSINREWFLVDLPGYGYAKVSKDKRQQWAGFIQDYILHRDNLINLFVLVDSRIPPQKIDLEFINWLGENQVPFCILLTKTDDRKNSEISKNKLEFENALKKSWLELPQIVMTSAVTKQGRDEVLDLIEKYKDQS